MASSLPLLPADVLLRVLQFVGAFVGPVVSACARGTVPEAAAAAILRNLCQARWMLARPFSRMPTPPTATYGYLCRILARSLLQPLQRVARARFYYPGFHEAAAGVLLLARSRCRASPGTLLRRLCGIAADAVPFDLMDYLTMDLDLSGDPLTAWLELNDSQSIVLQTALRRAVTVLRRGHWQFHFFPADLFTGRSAIVILEFSTFGLVGALAAEEPDVDPAGFYV